jgi:ParB family chromosome partitioning protein
MSREPDSNQRKVLGKGLSALLPPRGSEPAKTKPLPIPEPSKKLALPENFEEFHNIALEQIEPNEGQPRGVFDQAKLEELAQSIRANGLIQPITVLKSGAGKYRIVAGERRWRAAKMAGLTQIPALVRSVEADRLFELALIENIQREDLNAIETATAFQRLVEEYSLSHEEIAQRTGKDRSTISNSLRLLKLAPHVKEELVRGAISMGHARALLNIGNHSAQAEACDEIVARGLSVRQTEAMVKERSADIGKAVGAGNSKKGGEIEDPNIRAAIDELQAALGTRVRLVPKGAGAGRLEVEYYSQEDLDRIYSVIVKQ